MSEDEVKSNPNLNERGHSLYPKWIDHPTEKDKSGKWPKRVLVKTKKDEEVLLGRPVKEPKGGWPGSN